MITLFYFSSKRNGEEVVIMITFKKIYIVDDLKTNMFVDINIMMSEKIDILVF